MEQIETMNAEKPKEKIAKNPISDMPNSRGIKRLPSENEKSDNLALKKIKQQSAIIEENEDGMSVPNWLIDVLKWITRIEMAHSSLSFSCKLFNRLCWPKLHGNVKPHIVSYLEFCHEPNEFGDICSSLNDISGQIIPIAAIQPPKYIQGFGRIYIRFLDTQIIEFFKNIALEKIDLSFDETSMEKWQQSDDKQQFNLMNNLLTILAKNIYELQISNSLYAHRFVDFNRQFPTFIDQVPYLNVTYICDLDFDILFNWLMKPLTDGKQKILRYRIKFGQQITGQRREMEQRFINRIKKEFSHSTERRNFLVQLEHNYDQFSLQNEQTGEMLDLYQQMSRRAYYHCLNNFLAQYPKGEKHWKEWSGEKMQGNEATDIRVNI